MHDIIPKSMVSINSMAINNTWSDILYSPVIYRGFSIFKSYVARSVFRGLRKVFQ